MSKKDYTSNDKALKKALKKKCSSQPDLFNPELDFVIDKLNKRFGKIVVCYGDQKGRIK